MIIQGDWAAGCLAIGIGVIPFVAGLAALVRAPGEERTHELRMFRSVALAGIVTFGFYTAFKAAFLSTVFATRVEERNLIYIAPLLFVGTALVFSRRRISYVGLAVSGAYTLYLVAYALYHVTQYPYQMGIQLYSDALGFAILQQGNRFLSWTPGFVRWLLVGIFFGGMLVLLAPRLLRGRDRLVGAVLGVAAVAIVGWNVTGELAAATATKSIARLQAAELRHPFGWVDSATHLKPTLYMGEAEIDQNPEWLLEFWNRSITRVSSLDGSVLGPGPVRQPEREAQRRPVLAERSERTDPAVHLRGGGPALHRLRRTDGRDARVSRREQAANVEARPARRTEPAAEHMQRHLRRPLDRSV